VADNRIVLAPSSGFTGERRGFGVRWPRSAFWGLVLAVVVVWAIAVSEMVALAHA
jgi:hypothetical protein